MDRNILNNISSAQRHLDRLLEIKSEVDEYTFEETDMVNLFFFKNGTYNRSPEFSVKATSSDVKRYLEALDTEINKISQRIQALLVLGTEERYRMVHCEDTDFLTLMARTKEGIENRHSTATR